MLSSIPAQVNILSQYIYENIFANSYVIIIKEEFRVDRSAFTDPAPALPGALCVQALTCDKIMARP